MLYVVEESFDVPVACGTVYQAINNVGEIGYCLAGVKEVKILNDSESQWKIEVRAGFLAQTINLHGRITERLPDQRLGFAADGMHLSVSGSINLEALDSALTTRCRVSITSEVTGALAPVIDLIAKTTQKRLVEQSIKNFHDKLLNHQPVASR